MKPLAICLVLLTAGCALVQMSVVPQTQQSLTLPARPPTVCQPGFTVCGYPYVLAGTTGMVIAGNAPSGIKDSLGHEWEKDYCLPFTPECIYTTYFTETVSPPDVISFAPGEGYTAILAMYPGKLVFRYAAEGDYQHSNADIVGAGCMNGEFFCPYWWTAPLDADPGNLLVFVAETNLTMPGIPKPGAGWYVEALTDGEAQIILADMTTPIDGLYMGNMTILNSGGSASGGSHWVAATLAYERAQ